MDTSLFRKALTKSMEAKPRGSAFETVEEEVLWTQGSDYDLRNIITVTPYSSYSWHRRRSKVVLENKPHGDFTSDYPYSVIRTLSRGVFYHEYEVQFSVGGPWTIYGYGKTGGVNTNRGQQQYKDAIARIKSVANIAIADKILKDRESWDVLTDFAELRETSSFLKDCGESLVHILQGVATRNPRRVLKGFKVKPTRASVSHVNRTIRKYLIRQGAVDSAQVMRAASSLWLSYRYGLMPLIYS